MFLKKITFTRWADKKEMVKSKLNKITLVVGNSGSGKSYLLKEIFYGTNPNDNFDRYLITPHNDSSFIRRHNGIPVMGLHKSYFNRNHHLWFEHYASITGDKILDDSFNEDIEDVNGNRYALHQLPASRKKMMSILSFLADKRMMAPSDLALKDNSLILIDEFENSLHPTIQLAFLRVLDRYMPDNHQFIISTHSPLVGTQFPSKDRIYL